MNRQEFNERCKVRVTDTEYKKIETVYTFHPSISETEGKNQIAMLVEMFGMRIIEDMLPTAEKARDYEDKILATKMKLGTLVDEFENFKKGAR